MAAGKGICRFQRIRFRPALNGRDGARPSRGGPRSLVAASERPVIRGGPCSVMAAGKGICRFQRIRFRPALNGRDGARPSRAATVPRGRVLTIRHPVEGHAPSWPQKRTSAGSKGSGFGLALNGRDGARPSKEAGTGQLSGIGPKWRTGSSSQARMTLAITAAWAPSKNL
jgi:hypothetical protein